jgi:hypothetical protein
VFWENLGTSTIARVCATAVSWIFTLILIFGGVVVIYFIKLKQQDELDYMKDKLDGKDKVSYTDKGLIYGISGGAAASVFVINFLMKFAIRRFSLGEMHDT